MPLIGESETVPSDKVVIAHRTHQLDQGLPVGGAHPIIRDQEHQGGVAVSRPPETTLKAHAAWTSSHERRPNTSWLEP